jgi:predicted ATP-grasp superfamily ATP-dependent carboligase
MTERKLYIASDLKDFTDNTNVIVDFINRCNEELSIADDCSYKIYFVNDRKRHGIKTTAFYNPDGNVIKIYAKGRMIIDCLRSLAHEMTHMMQQEKGLITKPVKDEGGFHEDQANAKAGLIVKRFIKQTGIDF